MTQERPVSTKALNAFLRDTRQTTLSNALARIGILDYQQYLSGETLSADLVGRIARLLGFTPQRLTELVETHIAA